MDPSETFNFMQYYTVFLRSDISLVSGHSSRNMNNLGRETVLTILLSA